MDKRNLRKVLEGTVISSKMDKTVVVKITRKVRHSNYEKLIEKWKKCYAHDETNMAKVGDVVRIMETRPLSKTKRFRITEIL